MNKPVAILIRPDLPRPPSRGSRKKHPARDVRPQQPAKVPHSTSSSGHSSTPAVPTSRKLLVDQIQSDPSNSGSDTVDSDRDLALSPDNTAQQEADLSTYNVPTTLKRKRPAPGAYTMPRPPKDRKKPRVSKSAEVKTEVIEIDSDSSGGPGRAKRQSSSDDDSIPYRAGGSAVPVEWEDAPGMSDKDGVGFALQSTGGPSKRITVKDWYGSSR